MQHLRVKAVLAEGVWLHQPAASQPCCFCHPVCSMYHVDTGVANGEQQTRVLPSGLADWQLCAQPVAHPERHCAKVLCM